MANWTPEGVVGKMLKAHVALVPPPAGVASPLGWGVEDTVRERFGKGVESITFTKRTIELRFAFAPAGVSELFAACYGPTVSTLRALDPAGQSKLREELTHLFTEHNLATDGGTVVASEYLDVQARVA